jgi:hypothetical protein
MINSEKLEKLLLTNWTEILDVRELRNKAKIVAEEFLQVSNLKIQKFTISRFEFTERGCFCIWLEYSTNTGKSLTTEALLTKSDFVPVKTIEN